MHGVAAASQRRRRDHAAYSGALIVGLLTMLALWPTHVAPATRPIVYVAPIEGMIDLGLAPFVRRVLDEAAAVGAAAVSPGDQHVRRTCGRGSPDP